MDQFHMIVLAVAVIILILILTYIGLKIKNTRGVISFPPQANSCPDYWQMSDSSACIIPSATTGINLGTLRSNTTALSSTPGYDSTNNVVDFNSTLWSSRGKTSVCAKRQWANTYGVMWDGVSNYNSC